MLKKSPVDLKEILVKVSLALLVLSILASVIAIAPVVKAQGYPNVPTFPPSTPTPIPSPTSKPSPTASPSPTEIPWNFPTYNPTQNPKAEEGFWSPITIGIVAVALAAFTIPAAFFYIRRGKQEMLLDQERPINTPEFPAASNRYSTTSRYGQSSYQSSYQSQQPVKPTETTRYGQSSSYGYRSQQSSSSVTTRSTQTSSYSRPSAYTKFCPNCKRAVRNDQNVCPHCDKRL